MAINISPPLDIKMLSEFLEEINNNPKAHIGYCGESKSEIYKTLLNNFSDLELSRSFVVAFDKEEIIGALGFDIDEQNNTAEVWGPFIKNKEEFQFLANDLWKEMNLLANMKIESYSFFINTENMLAREFVMNLGAIENGHYFILKAYRTNTITELPYGITKYKSSYKNSFDALHAMIFPQAYFSSVDILKRINAENQLLLMINADEKLKGYVYVEADPENGEGTIEYVAVSPDYRKQGIGPLLIKAALNHLFSYEEIAEITLCVASENKKAIHLYKAAGFQVKNELVYLKM